MNKSPKRFLVNHLRTCALGAGLLFALPALATTPQEFAALLEQARGGAHAAEQQCQVAQCYEKGDGVEKDSVRAASWYSNAASYGSARALKWLQAHSKGKGTKATERGKPQKSGTAKRDDKTTELVNLLADSINEQERATATGKKAPKFPLKDVAALLREGADPNQAVSPGKNKQKPVSAMDLAAELGSTKLNDLLLAHGGTFMLNWRNAFLGVIYRMGVAERRVESAGKNADVRRAAEADVKRAIQSMRYMLQHGHDARMLDTNGNTMLHRAAQMGSAQSISILVESGADVNQPNEPQQACDASSQYIDQLGRTALFAAIDMGAVECVETLLKLGADAHYADKQGTTPAAWAEQKLESCRTSNIPEDVRDKQVGKQERCLKLLQAAK